MGKREDHPRWKELHVGVRDDGTCEGYQIETYLALPYAVLHPNQCGYKINHENRFVAFTIDNGGVDTEVRLPFETVEFLIEKMNTPADPS